MCVCILRQQMANSLCHSMHRALWLPYLYLISLSSDWHMTVAPWYWQIMGDMGEALAMFRQTSQALTISVGNAGAWLGQSHNLSAGPSQEHQVIALPMSLHLHDHIASHKRFNRLIEKLAKHSLGKLPYGATIETLKALRHLQPVQEAIWARLMPFHIVLRSVCCYLHQSPWYWISEDVSTLSRKAHLFL